MNRARPLRELLRSLRISADLTIEGLAERSGVSDRTISDIERGMSAAPRHGTLVALADGLGLDGSSRSDFFAVARDARRPSPGAAMRVDREPHRLGDFSGRASEIDRVVGVLAQPPLAGTAPGTVVLSGAPGVGKSTIAIEAAHRDTPGGRKRLFVDLGGIDAEPADPLVVLRSLIGQLTGTPDESQTLDQACSVWNAVTSLTPVAVVLDDAASEAQVRPVLSADNRSVVIVTSRRALAGLDHARHLHVGVLSRDDSLALLRRIVPVEQREHGDLDELSRLCGDLPLALRIAASRIASRPGWTVEDFSRRLRSENRRLGTLAAGDTTISAAFSASYTQLTPPARELFRTLSLLHGSSFAAPMAAAALGSPFEKTLDLLDELSDLGLVEMLTGDRYRLHDLLRLYARERLEEETSPEAVARTDARLGRWILATAANAGDHFGPRRPAAPGADGQSFDSAEDARHWLVSEVDYWFTEYRRAAAEGRPVAVLEAVPSITWFADRWIPWGRWHEFFEIAADSAKSLGDGQAEVEALNNLAFMHLHETFDLDLALVAARRALDGATDRGDERQRAWALNHLATVYYRLGDDERSMAAGQQSVDLFAGLGDLEGELQPRNTLATQLIGIDPEAALVEFERIIEITHDPSASLSDDFRYGTRLNVMGQAAKALLALERYDEALVAAQALLTAAEGAVFASEGEIARAYRHRGFAYLGLGDPALARPDLEKALRTAGTSRPDWWAAEIDDALRTLRSGSDS